MGHSDILIAGLAQNTLYVYCGAGLLLVCPYAPNPENPVKSCNTPYTPNSTPPHNPPSTPKPHYTSQKG